LRPDNALRIADGLRQTVMECHFAWETRSFNIGVSIGLSRGDGMFTLTDVLSAADTACYMQGKGPKPRPGLSRRGQRTVDAAGRNGVDRAPARRPREDRFVLYSQDIAGLDPARKLENHCRNPDSHARRKVNWCRPWPSFGGGTLQPHPSSIGWFACLRSCPAKARISQPPAFSHKPVRASIGDERFWNTCGTVDHFGIAAKICFEIRNRPRSPKNWDKDAFINSSSPWVACSPSNDFGVGMSSFAYLKHLRWTF